MAKRSGVSLPAGQGGLLGGLNSEIRSKFQISPKFVIFVAIAVVVFILILYSIN